MMKPLFVSILFVVACGGAKKAPATTSGDGSATPPTESAAIPNTDACKAVHGTCVSMADGAACQSTSADECAEGQVCCNN